ncbi:hypothetical protein [Neolewinella agarilytica]|nr:hypothetical protein [Neolewinella agarilytica]
MSPQSLSRELITNLNPGDGDSHPHDFNLVGDDLYFMGREASRRVTMLNSVVSLIVSLGDGAQMQRMAATQAVVIKLQGVLSCLF